MQSLAIEATLGNGNPRDNSLSVFNRGGGVLNWTTAHTIPWLSLSPESGSAMGTTDVANASAVIGSTAGIDTGIGYKIVQDDDNLCGGPCP